MTGNACRSASELKSAGKRCHKTKDNVQWFITPTGRDVHAFSKFWCRSVKGKKLFYCARQFSYCILAMLGWSGGTDYMSRTSPMFWEWSKFWNFMTIFGITMINAFKQVQTCLVLVGLLSESQSIFEWNFLVSVVQNLNSSAYTMQCLKYGWYQTGITMNVRAIKVTTISYDWLLYRQKLWRRIRTFWMTLIFCPISQNNRGVL